jgi:hypothetical protein
MNSLVTSTGSPRFIISPASSQIALLLRRLMALGQWEVTTIPIMVFLLISTRVRCTSSAVPGSRVPVGSSAKKSKGSLAN